MKQLKKIKSSARYLLTSNTNKVLGYFENIIGLSINIDLDIDDTSEYYPIIFLRISLEECIKEWGMGKQIQNRREYPGDFYINVLSKSNKPIGKYRLSTIVPLEYIKQTQPGNIGDLMVAVKHHDNVKPYELELWKYFISGTKPKKNVWKSFSYKKKMLG